MYDLVMGIDIHIIQPPGPVPPVPIPHPFIGMVFDPMEFIPILGATVWVNGMPRAQAGSEGKNIPPHIPIGGTFIKPIDNECEVFMGSLTVSVEGEPLSRLGMPVLSCSCIGMPSPPRPTKKPDAGMKLPTSVLMAIPMGRLVTVGGPPMISLMAVGMKILGAGFKFLKGTKRWKKASDKIHELAGKVTKKLPENLRNKIHKGICSVTGHPVDIVTGKVFTERVDFSLPGPIPLEWERTWYSTSAYQGPLGYGWHHTYDLSIRINPENGNLHLRLSDGRNAYFPYLADGEEYYIRQEQIRLIRKEGLLILVQKDGLRYHFDCPKPGTNSIHRLKKIEHLAGHRIEFTYNQSGGLQQIIDSAGRILPCESNQKGQLLAVRAPHPGHQHIGETFPLIQYRYDQQGNLIEMIDAIGNSFHYRYQNHLLVKEINRNGLSFYFEYDGDDESARCTRTWGDGGIYDHKLSYDLEQEITIVENSLGHKSQYFWTDEGQVYKEIDPLGAERLYQYGAFGQLNTEIDALQRVTRYEYDDEGNKTGIIYPDGSEIRMTYEDNLLTAAIDQNGGSWSWTYNEQQQLIARTNCMGQTTQYIYHSGHLKAIIAPNQGRTELTRDKSGNIISITSPDSAQSRWRYDLLGRIIESIDPRGNSQQRKFNLLGNVLKIKEPDGNTRIIEYDAEENITRSKDLQQNVLFEYKGMNRLGARIEAGTRVEFKYDTEEDLIGIINEHGYAYRFELDQRGDVITESGFDGLTRRYIRDKAGQVTKVLRPGDRTSNYTYENLGRIQTVQYWDGSFEKYSYRADGKLIEANNGAIKVSYERDLLGRIIEEQQGGFIIKSDYDDLGNRIALSSSLGAQLNIERNLMGDVTSVNSSKENQRDAWSVQFGRDLLGLELERSLPGGVRSNWKRDRLGRPTKLVTTAGGQKTNDRTYKWGINDRLHEILDDKKGRFVFEHDVFGNLSAATYPDGSKELRMPDAVGNLFRRNDRKDRVYGPAGQLLEAEGTKFSYDLEGNMRSKIRPNGDRWSYEWNAAGRLAKVIRPDGKMISFTYDALGRRIAKEYGNQLTRWVWDANVVLHEWQESKPLVLTNGNEKGKSSFSIRRRDKKTDHHPTLDSEIVQLEETWASSAQEVDSQQLTTWIFEPGSFAPMAKLGEGQSYSIISDHLGTPLAMYSDVGQKVWEMDLSIYGKVRNLDGWRESCPFRYPGQYEDVETGLYYNRFRYYDPELGGYLSQDPIRLYGSNPNIYAYTKDVNSWIDPFGLDQIFDSSNEARRQAMRDAGIPTSQQPISQSKNASGMEYRYQVPAEGGGTKIMSVQQQTLDSSHIGEPHWEAGEVKLDDNGKVRMNDYNRPKLKNQGKTKANYKPTSCN